MLKASNDEPDFVTGPCVERKTFQQVNAGSNQFELDPGPGVALKLLEWPTATKPVAIKWDSNDRS